MMKLRFADHFGRTPGSCWRIVYALFPWLHPYRNARPQLFLNRRGSICDSFSYSKDWSFGHAFDPKKSIFSDTSENERLDNDTTSAIRLSQYEKDADGELQGSKNYSSVPGQSARVVSTQMQEDDTDSDSKLSRLGSIAEAVNSRLAASTIRRPKFFSTRVCQVRPCR